MKDSPRQQFRWAPHVSGCASLKPKDYEQRGEVEALHEYDAWRRLRESGEPLGSGRSAGKRRMANCGSASMSASSRRSGSCRKSRQHQGEPEPAGQPTAN